MSQGWENYESAPLEFFHSLAMTLFHEYRLGKGNDITVQINGSEFGNIIAKAKMETYKKYPKQVTSKPIPKTEI